MSMVVGVELYNGFKASVRFPGGCFAGGLDGYGGTGLRIDGKPGTAMLVIPKSGVRIAIMQDGLVALVQGIKACLFHVVVPPFHIKLTITVRNTKHAANTTVSII